MSSIIVDDKPVEDGEEEVEGQEQKLNVEDGIPEKFKGKSTAEVVEAFLNLEREKSRLGNELGELRQLTDKVLELKVAPTDSGITDEEEEELDADTLWAEPDKAIAKKIARSPEVKKVGALESRLNELEATLALTKFQEKHKDFQATAQSEEFREWIQASPHRVKKAQQADAYDLDAADELFTDWEERQAFIQEKAPEKKKATHEKIKKTGLETGSTGSKGGKKVLKRVDLIKLRMEDPDRYYDPAMQEEIKAAYREKRVR